STEARSDALLGGLEFSRAEHESVATAEDVPGGRIRRQQRTSLVHEHDSMGQTVQHVRHGLLGRNPLMEAALQVERALEMRREQPQKLQVARFERRRAPR